MATNRLWMLGTLVFVLILLAGTWFLGISPQLEAATRAAVDRTAVEQQNRVHQQTLESLKEQYEGITSLRAELEDLREAIPQDLNETPFVDQVGDLALANNVVVESFQFDIPTPYIPGETTDSDVAAAMAQVSSGNFYVITVRIDATGTDLDVLNFVDALQKGTRTFLIYELAIVSVSDDISDGFRVNISGEVFMLGTGASAPVDPGTSVVRATPAA